MLVLGLETSCDETAAGIVEDSPDPSLRIRANAVATQLAEHKPYGGVVPEIAARAHLDRLDDLILQALKEANATLGDLSGVAATCGPGLIGGVMVGSMTGKAIAAVRKLPFVAVNHLEAHALTARLTNDVAFPYLLLLVSGGHCQLLLVKGVGDYRRLGTTVDDAVGECFDKSAKLLGLGYPGGPQIEKAAAAGNPRAFKLPRPMIGRKGCDFSFAGLKTAVRMIVAQPSASPTFVPDMAASLQAAIADILADRTKNAFDLLRDENQPVSALVVAGGVAANKALRERLAELAARYGTPFAAPPLALCTDNGVMVAWAGLERLRLGLTDNFSVAARPRWPLENGIRSTG
ncbi:MAG: tRNA (adenosine(37)-N6)-threonylcarbamoyltransferase complex transferase subunit TsaD [Alphaproteobacteria bacterium]|nr:tRNA (adenosine(37)-N6)-threonylcarbamoyltransferase complex transferase subunit TsaD [Alphaproteobacteria bacterium]